MSDKFGDTAVRIAAMWPFPMPTVPEALIEAFEDREDRLPRELADLCARWSDEEREELFSGPCEAETAWEELACEAHNAGVAGFICIADCPVFKGSGDGAASYSWGHWRSQRFFAPTADAAIEKAVEWAEGEFKKTVQVAA